jgi:hypothetical protein
VPRLVSVSDGINLMSAQRIESGSVKVVVEEVDSRTNFDAEFQAILDGTPVTDAETFRTDPLASRYEANFRLPAATWPGGHVLEVRLGTRTLTTMGIEVV